MPSLDAEEATRHEKTRRYKTRRGKVSYEVAKDQDSDRQDPKSLPRPPKPQVLRQVFRSSKKKRQRRDRGAQKKYLYSKGSETKRNETKQSKVTNKKQNKKESLNILRLCTFKTQMCKTKQNHKHQHQQPQSQNKQKRAHTKQKDKTKNQQNRRLNFSFFNPFFFDWFEL
jgi:hypothetical protein